MWFRKKKTEFKVTPIKQLDGDIIVISFEKGTSYDEIIRCKENIRQAYKDANISIPTVFTRGIQKIVLIDKKEELK